MLSNFVKIALRNLRSDSYNFLLNLIGLVLGVSCFVALQIYTHHESTYENFLTGPDDLYRVTTYFKRGDNEVKWAITNGGLVDVLRNDVAQVEDAMKIMTVQQDLTFKIEDRLHGIPERTGFYSDSNFFNVLDFNLIKGNPKTALDGADKIILSNKLASRLFPNDYDVLGKKIEIVNADENQELIVTGVVDVPSNSHLQFDFLFSGYTADVEYWNKLSDPKRGGYPVRVYFRKKTDSDLASLTTAFEEAHQTVYGDAMQFPIQPITDIHFNAPNLFEDAKIGNYNFVRILSIISYIILLIACINYVILNTSKLMKRNREIGVRKTLGSSVSNLITQFLMESALIGFISGLISLFTIEILLTTVFRYWFDISFSLFQSIEFIPAVLLFSMIIGIISGLYPAIQSSTKEAANILKQGLTHGQSGKLFSFRSILVIIQFAFTLSIIAGSILIVKQLEYLKNKDLGYEKDQLINVSRNNAVSNADWKFFVESLKTESSINSSGQILYDLLSDYNATGIRVPLANHEDTVTLRVQWNAVDHETLETLGVNFVEGRNFDSNIASDSSGIIINEAAKRALGMDSVVGSSVWNYFTKQGKIIGVIEDFHFQSFDKEIIPIMFHINFNKTNVLVNVDQSNYKEALTAMEENWNEAGIQAPFEYDFIDDSFKILIEKESRLSAMVKIFAFISICIALLGILGLVSHSTSLRMKEIGIRKVFGASTSSILLLINKNVILLISIAFVIAVPLTYWAGNNWLGNFVYKTNLTVFELLIGLIITALITVTAISFQSFGAARSNPAKTLKAE